MTHFCQAHQELRDTEAIFDKLGFQSVNAIAEQIVDRIRQEDNDVNIFYP